MKVLKVAIVCGLCGKVIEVEENPQHVEGVDTIGVIHHACVGVYVRD